MHAGVDYGNEIATTEAELKELEQSLGQDHERVSYCLDKLARLLRAQGTRTLDAINAEARAKAIRLKLNAAVTASITPQMEERREIIRETTVRIKQEKMRKKVLKIVVVSVLLAVGARFVLAPTKQEKAAVTAAVQMAQKYLPVNYIQNVVGQGATAAQDVQAANKAHNDQVERFLKQ